MGTVLLTFYLGLLSVATNGALPPAPRFQTTPTRSARKPAAPLTAATVSLTHAPTRSSPPPEASPAMAAAPATAVTREAATSAAVLPYAEQMPTFTGGDLALHRYLAANTTYPAEAFRTGLSGTVVMQFVVDEQGRALNPVVVKSSNPAFNAEAIRLIWLMPWWNPGRQQGQPVRVRCTLPIVFSFKRTP
jgi:protein TonB